MHVRTGLKIGVAHGDKVSTPLEMGFTGGCNVVDSPALGPAGVAWIAFFNISCLICEPCDVSTEN